MAVRDAERDGVHAGLTLDGRKRGADVRVEHGELELHVIEVGVRAPPTDLSVIFGDERGKGLWTRVCSDDVHAFPAVSVNTYHLVVDGVRLAGERLVDAAVFDRVDAEDIGLLERPCRDVPRKLPVAGLHTPSF